MSSPYTGRSHDLLRWPPMTDTPKITDIEAIMDLARAVEPAVKITPKFHLWSDAKGLWHANVSMDRYYVQSDGHDTPEGALNKLRGDLTGLNQSFIKRMTAALKRWLGAESPIRSVVEDAPTDPPRVDPPKVETPTATTEAPKVEPSSGETAKPETDNDNPEVDASRKGEPK